MIDKQIEQALNDQIATEARSSHFYLGMATWAETNGLNGTSAFLYRHSDEERQHMLKLIKFVNERGGTAHILLGSAHGGIQRSACRVHHVARARDQGDGQHQQVVDLCLSRKDYTTHNFMQWYVSEQIEEEALARTILDKPADWFRQCRPVPVRPRPRAAEPEADA